MTSRSEVAPAPDLLASVPPFLLASKPLYLPDFRASELPHLRPSNPPSLRSSVPPYLRAFLCVHVLVVEGRGAGPCAVTLKDSHRLRSKWRPPRCFVTVPGGSSVKPPRWTRRKRPSPARARWGPRRGSRCCRCCCCCEPCPAAPDATDVRTTICHAGAAGRCWRPGTLQAALPAAVCWAVVVVAEPRQPKTKPLQKFAPLRVGAVRSAIGRCCSRRRKG